MGEAIITRKGSGDASSTNKGILVTELITESKVWKAPKGILNNSISVRIFGAGGSGGPGGGGGGGYMNNTIMTVTPGQEISVTIGVGATHSAGGTSSFGSYLSANGGEAGTTGEPGQTAQHPPHPCAGES